MSNPLETRHRYFILAAILVSALLHFRIYNNPYPEWDEAVYLHLSQEMGWDLSGYSTRGSFIDDQLPGAVYSAEIFHHPPLIPYAIKTFSVFMPPFAAGRTMSLALVVVSVYIVFRLALSLSGFKAAMLATAFWVLCPIFNLESNLVHLDFPATLLILAGAWYFWRYMEQGGKRPLFISGALFALAMLTKFTAPVYVLLPLLLALSRKEFYSDRKLALGYFGLVGLGFLWWGAVFAHYGTLLPVDFVGDGTEAVHQSTYMDSMRARSWYHIWMYFAAFFPPVFFYAIHLGGDLLRVSTRREEIYTFADRDRFLLLLNIASLLAVIGFSVANALSNKAWAFRHIMPVFPVIYITTAHVLSRCLEGRGAAVKRATVTLSGATLILMAASTWSTIRNPLNLKVIPVIFYWFPALKPFFV